MPSPRPLSCSPYRGPVGVDASEGHEVAQMIGNLEFGSPGGAQQRQQGLEAQLAAARDEAAALRRQLAETASVEVPPSLQGELGSVVTAATVISTAAELEERLRAAEAEGEALRQRLGSSQGAGASGQGVAASEDEAAAVAAEAGMQVQELQARAAAAEAAGDYGEAAALRQHVATLQALQTRAAAAEEDAARLRRHLAELRPVRLTISTAAAAGDQPAASAAEPLPVPAALQAELGKAAPAAAIEAKASELEAQLGDAAREAGEVRLQLQIAVAADQASQSAAQQQHVLQAQLAAAAPGGSGGPSEEEVEALRRQLGAVQLQKEAAQGQLWQLAELQEQLAAAEAERKRLAAALRAAQPVSLRLAVGEAAEAAAAEAAAPEPAEAVQLRAELAEAQQRSQQLHAQLAQLQAAATGAEAPVRLSLRMSPGDAAAGSDADAAARLAAAEAEADRLRRQLADLQPIRLRLTLKEDAAHMATPGSDLVAALAPGRRGAAVRRSLDGASPMPALGGLQREASDSSLGFTAEQASELSKARAAADAAWREHQKARVGAPGLERGGRSSCCGGACCCAAPPSLPPHANLALPCAPTHLYATGHRHAGAAARQG